MLILLLFCLMQSYAETSPFYNMLDYGAKGDGITKNTESIQKAMEIAAEKGGGTLYFPPGTYLTGPIHCQSNITLYIDAGATLKFSDDFDDYLPMVLSRWEGTTGMNFSPLIYGYQIDNVSIVGQGTLDGQGKAWMDFYEGIRTEDRKYGEVKTQSKWQKLHRELNKETIKPDTWMWDNNNFLRPPFIQFYDCQHITIQGVTLVNSPFWTVNPVLCNNVTVTDVTIINPPESYNTDGINPSSCSNVHISNCHISVGDDCITLKSGRDEDGRRIGRPCENITITNCTMLNGHGGVVIGSEMSGDVRKVTIANCVFDGTDRGIRIKSMRGRGGVVEEIRVSNVVMKNIVQEAIKLNMFYRETDDEPVSERTPIFRNIHISHVTASQVKKAGALLGLDEMPIENVTLSDIYIEAQKGFEIKNVNHLEFHNVTVNSEKGIVIEGEKISHLELDGVKTLKLTTEPSIELTDVEHGFIHNANPIPGSAYYLSIDGAGTEDVVVKGNNFYKVNEPVIIGKNVPSDAVVVE